MQHFSYRPGNVETRLYSNVSTFFEDKLLLILGENVETCLYSNGRVTIRAKKWGSGSPGTKNVLYIKMFGIICSI